MEPLLEVRKDEMKLRSEELAVRREEAMNVRMMLEAQQRFMQDLVARLAK